jgi:hypothetical protein
MVPQLRALYRASFQLARAGDAAALHAADAERASSRRGLAALLAAQQAAVSAALTTLT